MAQQSFGRMTSFHDTPDGHDFNFSFQVDNTPWRALEEFKTNCPVMPTKWSFSITFQRDFQDGPLYWAALLTRNYNGMNAPVSASLWVSCFDVCHELLRFPTILKKGRMLVGDEIHHRFSVLLPAGGLVHLPQQRLNAEVSVLIRQCHSESETIDILSDSMKKMHFSPSHL